MPELTARQIHLRGLSWAFLGVLLFSFSVPLTKVAVSGFNPFFTATGRAVIAGVLAAVILSVNRVAWPSRSVVRPLLLTMVGAVFGWPILIAIALQYTTSAHLAVIIAFMPLSTAIIAVSRTHERVSAKFWLAASIGTVALVIFALGRGGASSPNYWADLLVVGATLFSSWCYVEGAAVTKVMPGWQVISWVVVFALPITVPVSLLLWFTTSVNYATTSAQWFALISLGISSMYFGFFAWYRGLSMAGIARGSQVQQLQALLTLLWSALLLGESVTLPTLLAACVVIACVVWAQRNRRVEFVAPEE
ncbi:MAG: DMT family transporter [Actinomycetota bacterium]|nr:DMT family transporter [Actinomycetota bacterium]